MRSNAKYDAISASAYYDEVVAGSSEAAYYLLKKRLGKALKAVYELHGFGLDDDFEDTLDDFFLYLYEGNQNVDNHPFEIVKGVRNKQAFFGWTVSAYRHFLINKSKEEAKRKALLERVHLLSKGEDNSISCETMIHILATAIACADQLFTPRNRFVFYRMLLSFLDHSKAIPQEAVAQALDMNPVTYRVSTKRQKDRFLELVLVQEAGTTLDLDAQHLLMRNRIIDGFERLYELLMEFYDKVLQSLPNAQAIHLLRLRYVNGDGMMHEGRVAYGYSNNLDIRVLYPNLKNYLTVSG